MNSLLEHTHKNQVWFPGTQLYFGSREEKRARTAEITLKVTILTQFDAHGRTADSSDPIYCCCCEFGAFIY